MPFIDKKEIETRDTLPGFHGKMTSTDHFTYIDWKLDAGSTLPEHSHPHEQLTSIEEGQMEFTLDGETRVLGPGMLVVIPPYGVHSGKTITDCRVVDIFYPVRDDYK